MSDIETEVEDAVTAHEISMRVYKATTKSWLERLDKYRNEFGDQAVSILERQMREVVEGE